MNTGRASANLERIKALRLGTPEPEPAPPAPAAGAAADPSAGLRALLGVEAAAREATLPEQLHTLMANETRKLAGARQVFVFSAGRTMRLVAISGLPKVERTAPLVRGMETVAAALVADTGHDTPHSFELSRDLARGDDFLERYPYQNLLWLPLRPHSGDAVGALLLASERPLDDGAVVIARRLAETFAHALGFLLVERPARRLSKRRFMHRGRLALAVLLAVVAAMMIPVPMTALAPLEITAKDPFIVAAPIEGVIKDVLVAPNEQVSKGQVLVRFEDTILRNRYEVAERQVLVAEARLKKANQLAFDDVRGRRDIGIAMAEHELKLSEFKFARDMFAHAEIKAPRDGIAIYTDRQELIGKPVTLGERILQIADPARVEVTVDVDVADAIVLQPGARAKVYLDSDPLVSHTAEVVGADYQARLRPGDVLAFQVIADLTDTGEAPPRLGARGTAQLYGEDVPLAFYLFRRPVSALRQWIGL